MHRYTDYRSQATAFAAAIQNDHTDRDSDTTTTPDTDWTSVFLVCVVAGWVCFQYYQPETGNLSRTGKPFARAVFAIARRLATDLALFVLTILAITAELLLEGKNVWAAALQRSRARLSRGLDSWRPLVADICLQYDAANHSHHANLTRQRLRALRASAGTILRWTAIIGVAFMIFSASPTEEGKSLEDFDVMPHVVPRWVIKARPENRPHHGSSSHYQPAHDSACIHNRQGQGEVRQSSFDERNLTKVSLEVAPPPESTAAFISTSQTVVAADRTSADLANRSMVCDEIGVCYKAS